MFEDNTYEALLAQKLASVSPQLDKREGSIIYDTLAPNALESAMLYAALDKVMKETFASTAGREYLILRCAERGITSAPATAAVGTGEFDADVPVGSRFSCDRYNWFVTSKKTDGKYSLQCETVGSAPNTVTGTLVPIEYIDGLGSAELLSIDIFGEDEEETESLRKRYFDSFNAQCYGFNKRQYIEVTEALPGVGGCKPYRAWNGAGTVKLVITDSSYGVPSSALIASVQTAIDPDTSGDGEGLAPIDHCVAVAGVTAKTVNIATNITFADGWNFTECKEYIEQTIDAYFKELNAEWSTKNNIIVRISQIEARMLTLDGITDIADTTLNGTAKNLTLGADEIAVRGSFTVA